MATKPRPAWDRVLPSRTEEAATITLARATLSNRGVKIDDMCPGEIRIGHRQPLVIRLQYRFEDISARRESFHVRLRSNIAGRDPPEAIRHHGDRPFLNDSQWGFIEQTYDVLPSGRHELEIEVLADYGVRAWGQRQREDLQQRWFEKRIPVVVDVE